MATFTEQSPQTTVSRFLTGKYALITGGSRGIGRGVAVKLAERGARVTITYVENESAAHQTLERVQAAGSDGLVLRVDVSKPAEIRRVVDTVAAEFGALDILVSNARSEVPTFYAAPLALSDEQWAMALDSQPTAFLHAVRDSAELMSDGGRIIAMTYGTGSRTGSWQPWVAMGAAKAALEALVRYFAVTLAPRGITVNAVSPGFTEDSVLNSLPETAQNLVRDWHAAGWTPMRRLGTPADIGNVVSLLCSEEAAWITGQTIYADGGASIVMPELPPALQQG